jgi:electron transport complex protein RnfC
MPSISLSRLDQAEPSDIATTVRNAGIAGAGGAGFPAHAKWARVDDAPFLMMNHQESEPIYYMDKHIGTKHAEDFARFFSALLEDTFDLIVVACKQKDREGWMGEFEAATDGSVYMPEDLPLEAPEESGVVFAYTDDKYEYGMESVLMRIAAGIPMRDELPMDHGFLVQNTESMYNVLSAIEDSEPVTHKYVHVAGNVSQHRFFEVPVGTPAATLLEATDRSLDDLGDHEFLADGGPGWCFELSVSPHEFGVRKRTNCLLALDQETVEGNIVGNGRINVLNEREWSGDHELEPTSLDAETVRIPLRTNPDFFGVVDRSDPIVEPGDAVEAGEMIAVPAGENISNTQHASIDGRVEDVTETHIEITAMD